MISPEPWNVLPWFYVTIRDSIFEFFLTYHISYTNDDVKNIKYEGIKLLRAALFMLYQMQGHQPHLIESSQRSDVRRQKVHSTTVHTRSEGSENYIFDRQFWTLENIFSNIGTPLFMLYQMQRLLSLLEKGQKIQEPKITFLQQHPTSIILENMS